MLFEDVIRTRTAVRKFNGEKVHKDQLDKILEAGRMAPTAKNIQPQKIYVIESNDALTKINDASPCIYGSSTVLLVCSDKNTAFKKDDHSTYEIDACIAATHMMLEATNVGVDSIWVEMFDKDKIINYFNIEEEPICLIPLGYRSSDYMGNPMHEIRKDISEMVSFL